MAMSRAKVTLFFSNFENGWSETYYCPAGTLTEAFTSATALTQKRLALMGRNSVIDSVRVNDVDTPRASQLTPVNLSDGSAYTSSSDAVSNAAMMRLYSTLGNRTRAIYLRGNPDSAFDVLNPNNADSQTWKAAFAAFGNFLKGTGTGNVTPWLIKFAPDASVPGVKKKIISWDAATPSTLTTVVTEAIAATENQFFTVYGMKGLPFPPGKTKIAKVIVPTTSFELVYRTPSDFVYESGGTVVLYDAGYITIGDFAANVRFTGRKTGRPSDVSRGRRPSIRR